MPEMADAIVVSSTGDFLTRVFVWVALGGYSASVILQLLPNRIRMARWIWIASAAAFAIHVMCAFHFFHGWSHTAAFIETARQTKEMTGVASGGGLYLNYAFTVWWVVDAVWWLCAGDKAYVERNRRITSALHGFFVFMFVNGAIVFGRGPVRWYGAAMVAMMLGAVLLLGLNRSSEGKS